MVKLNTITTKTGDHGTTGLVGGTLDGKDTPRILAIGEVEEAGAARGGASLFVSPTHLPLIRRIKNELFDMGAGLATPDMAQEGALRITPAQVAWLETEQDRLNADLAPLTSFVLPGGSPSAAHLHVARASVRRAEREVSNEQDPMGDCRGRRCRGDDVVYADGRGGCGDHRRPRELRLQQQHGR